MMQQYFFKEFNKNNKLEYSRYKIQLNTPIPIYSKFK
jgi:hypothetical protein